MLHQQVVRPDDSQIIIMVQLQKKQTEFESQNTLGKLHFSFNPTFLVDQI
jgi:hypothetical protein